MRVGHPDWEYRMQTGRYHFSISQNTQSIADSHNQLNQGLAKLDDLEKAGIATLKFVASLSRSRMCKLYHISFSKSTWIISWS